MRIVNCLEAVNLKMAVKLRMMREDWDEIITGRDEILKVYHYVVKYH